MSTIFYGCTYFSILQQEHPSFDYKRSLCEQKKNEILENRRIKHQELLMDLENQERLKEERLEEERLQEERLFDEKLLEEELLEEERLKEERLEEERLKEERLEEERLQEEELRFIQALEQEKSLMLVSKICRSGFDYIDILGMITRENFREWAKAHVARAYCMECDPTRFNCVPSMKQATEYRDYPACGADIFCPFNHSGEERSRKNKSLYKHKDLCRCKLCKHMYNCGIDLSKLWIELKK